MLACRFSWVFFTISYLMVAAVVAAENSTSLQGENKVSNQPLFYRGELDDKVVTVENGARVNSDYAAFVAEGPWAEVKIWEVSPRIHSVVGYGLANYTFIEGDKGLLLVDSGQNIGAALEVLKMKNTFSEKPVVAVIYTHFHYTRGTRAIVDSYPDLDIPIYGHPDLNSNMEEVLSYLAPISMRRGAKQFGHHLPTEGPDAEYSITEPTFDDPALNASGHMPVTHPVEDGQVITIDGLEVVFHHAIADTEDSLVIHIPELDVVVHNTAVMPFMFPMYTLRGDYYRSTPDVIATIDKLRTIKPKYLVGCHGVPIIGREEVFEFSTMHRDALAYVYQQTVRAMNRGLSPDEIIGEVHLPEKFRNFPELYQAYVDVEHMIRGVYRGHIGWWANDTAELHPPRADELGAEIVQGFGGIDALLSRSEEVMLEKRYNLTAKLASYALADDPENQRARQIKAAALRKMAYATPTGIQTRNFMLHEALQLEGKIAIEDSKSSSAVPLSVEMVASMPPTLFLETLAYSVDGSRASNFVATVKIELTDIDKSYTLAIRYGAAEFLESAPDAYELHLAFDRRAWAELFLGQSHLHELLGDGRAEFTGDEDLKKAFLDAYKDVL